MTSKDDVLETLIAVRKSLAAEGLNTDVIDALISLKVRELNPWLPIDENTPKGRELLLLYSDKTKVVGVWHKDKGFDMYDDWLCKTITATHYQELPDDPEPGDKNG